MIFKKVLVVFFVICFIEIYFFVFMEIVFVLLSNEGYEIM